MKEFENMLNEQQLKEVSGGERTIHKTFRCKCGQELQALCTEEEWAALLNFHKLSC